MLAVAIGGGAGAVLRYAAHHSTVAVLPKHPYLATFVVNVAGSAALGALAGWVLGQPDRLPKHVEVGLTVGFLGALTTYSAFATDAVALVRDGRPWLASAYVAGTTGLAVGAAWITFSVVTSFFGSDPVSPGAPTALP